MSMSKKVSPQSEVKDVAFIYHDPKAERWELKINNKLKAFCEGDSGDSVAVNMLRREVEPKGYSVQVIGDPQ